MVRFCKVNFSMCLLAEISLLTSNAITAVEVFSFLGLEKVFAVLSKNQDPYPTVPHVWMIIFLFTG